MRDYECVMKHAAAIQCLCDAAPHLTTTHPSLHALPPPSPPKPEAEAGDPATQRTCQCLLPVNSNHPHD